MARGVDVVKAGVWRERFLRFEDDKEKVEDFCLAEGISKSSFYNWRRKLAPSKRRASAAQGRHEKKTRRSVFESVTIAAAAMVVIRLPDGTLIEVPTSSEQALRVIVGQLVSADIVADRC